MLFYCGGMTTTLSASATARAAADRFGGEDPDEWGPGVESDGIEGTDEGH